MAESGTPLDKQRYINLETFRQDGTGVKTPVWAAPLDGRLVIVTDGTSFKVKRLRANARCRAAACDARGSVLGAWYDGEARVIEDPTQRARALATLRKKYGWQIRVLDFFSWMGRRLSRRALLELTIK